MKINGHTAESIGQNVINVNIDFIEMGTNKNYFCAVKKFKILLNYERTKELKKNYICINIKKMKEIWRSTNITYSCVSSDK